MNDYQPAVKQSNTMGLVGFIISLVSLVGCGGLLSPISLIFSLIGLGKEPKGFAIAGLVLSLLGLSGCLIGLIIFGLTLPFMIIGLIAAVAAGVGVAAAVALLAIGQNAFEIVQDVRDYHQTNGAVPVSLDELNIEPSKLVDHWGNEFVYVPGDDGDSFLLISAGPDEVIANSDDLIGEININTNGVNAELHQGYGEINPTNWGSLPSATGSPALPENADGAGADSFPTPDPPQDPDAP